MRASPSTIFGERCSLRGKCVGRVVSTSRGESARARDRHLGRHCNRADVDDIHDALELAHDHVRHALITIEVGLDLRWTVVIEVEALQHLKALSAAAQEW